MSKLADWISIERPIEDLVVSSFGTGIMFEHHFSIYKHACHKFDSFWKTSGSNTFFAKCTYGKIYWSTTLK